MNIKYDNGNGNGDVLRISDPLTTVGLQCSNTIGILKICSIQGKFELMSVNHRARSGGILGISFRFYFEMKVCYVFSLESPHRGDSNENTHYTIFNIKKKITLIIPNLQQSDFFQGTQERVRNSRGKRASSVRAIGLL